MDGGYRMSRYADTNGLQVGFHTYLAEYEYTIGKQPVLILINSYI
jgi:hypothetical protein